MKKISIILFAFFIYLNVTAQEVQKIRIDPSKSFGGTISEYFDSIEYIPLETTKESLFGEIRQLVISDSSFVILDFDTRAILFFQLNGKYIRKVSFANDEFPNLYYDKTEQNIALNIYKNGKRLEKDVRFTLQGIPVKKERGNSLSSENKPHYYLGNGYYFELNNCQIFDWKNVSKDTVFLISIYRNDTLLKSFLPIIPANNLGFCRLAGSLTIGKADGNDIFVGKPITNEVYWVKRDTVTNIFQFIFPQNRSYPSNLLASTSKDLLDSAYQTLRQNPKIIYGVSNIFFKKNLLFFKTMSSIYITPRDGSESELQYNFVYDTLTGKLFSLERLTPDITSFFLPVIGNLSSTEGLNITSKFLYSSLSSLTMFSAKEKTKSKNPQYPPALQQYFKTQNRKSNPVIVKMKLRE
jgi:hypothetical protein